MMKRNSMIMMMTLLSPLSLNLNISPPKDRSYIIYLTMLIMSTTCIFPSKGLHSAISSSSIQTLDPKYPFHF